MLGATAELQWARDPAHFYQLMRLSDNPLPTRHGR